MKLASLQYKVLGIVAAAMLLAAAVGLGSVWLVYRAIQDLDRVSREDFLGQQQLLRASASLKDQVADWNAVLLQGSDDSQREIHWNNYLMHEKEAAEMATEARAKTPHAEVRASLEAFIAAHKSAGERYRAAFETFKESKYDPYAGRGAAEGADMMAVRALQEADAKAEELGRKSVEVAVQGANRVFRYALAAFSLAVAGALLGLWYYMRRAVLVPLRSAARSAERISHGDLTEPIAAGSQDEAGQLLAALGRMRADLFEVVLQVRESAERVAGASEDMRAGTADLSQRTEEQASGLEQTAASMEELASTVARNAESAREADALARGAYQRARVGGEEVSRAVETMGKINQSARRIADIVSMIDGIAFQTNILSLNAAVEAARAGEQGRGFAVVAAEVRALAQRSARAAREIKALIGESVGTVEHGTGLVECAGATIQALVSDVQRVSELMASIAEASEEQSRGVQQVNVTVTEMDKVVQQNAAVVAESAATAEALQRQAEMLVNAVGAFRLSSTEAVSPASTAPRFPAIAPPPKTALARAGSDDDWQCSSSTFPSGSVA